MPTEREELYARGIRHILTWCELNRVLPPEIKAYREGEPKFGVCAYYRDDVIHIWINACAKIGRVGRQWSYPGYTVDRTPYGVLAHELGHHVDRAHGQRGGVVSHIWRRETQEEPIGGYAPDDNEWFAEIFRLYVTNPSFLFQIRPRMYCRLQARWPNHAETRDWEQILIESNRHINAAQNKIRKAIKYRNPQQDYLF